MNSCILFILPSTVPVKSTMFFASSSLFIFEDSINESRIFLMFLSTNPVKPVIIVDNCSDMSFMFEDNSSRESLAVLFVSSRFLPNSSRRTDSFFSRRCVNSCDTSTFVPCLFLKKSPIIKINWIMTTAKTINSIKNSLPIINCPPNRHPLYRKSNQVA